MQVLVKVYCINASRWYSESKYYEIVSYTNVLESLKELLLNFSNSIETIQVYKDVIKKEDLYLVKVYLNKEESFISLCKELENLGFIELDEKLWQINSRIYNITFREVRYKESDWLRKKIRKMDTFFKGSIFIAIVIAISVVLTICILTPNNAIYGTLCGFFLLAIFLSIVYKMCRLEKKQHLLIIKDKINQVLSY